MARAVSTSAAPDAAACVAAPDAGVLARETVPMLLLAVGALALGAAAGTLAVLGAAAGAAAGALVGAGAGAVAGAAASCQTDWGGAPLEHGGVWREQGTQGGQREEKPEASSLAAGSGCTQRDRSA